MSDGAVTAVTSGGGVTLTGTANCEKISACCHREVESGIESSQRVAGGDQVAVGIMKFSEDIQIGRTTLWIDLQDQLAGTRGNTEDIGVVAGGDDTRDGDGPGGGEIGCGIEGVSMIVRTIPQVRGDHGQIILAIIGGVVFALTPLDEGFGISNSHDGSPHSLARVVTLGRTRSAVVIQSQGMTCFVRGGFGDVLFVVTQTFWKHQRWFVEIPHVIEGSNIRNTAGGWKTDRDGNGADEDSDPVNGVGRSGSCEMAFAGEFGGDIDVEWCEILGDTLPDVLNAGPFRVAKVVGVEVGGPSWSIDAICRATIPGGAGQYMTVEIQVEGFRSAGFAVKSEGFGQRCQSLQRLRRLEGCGCFLDVKQTSLVINMQGIIDQEQMMK